MIKSKKKSSPPPSPIQSYVRAQQQKHGSSSSRTRTRPSSPTTTLHRLRNTLSSTPIHSASSQKSGRTENRGYTQPVRSPSHSSQKSAPSRNLNQAAPSPASSSASSSMLSQSAAKPRKKVTSDSTSSQGKKQRNGQAPFAAPSAIHSDSQDPFRHPDKYAWSRKLDGHRGLYHLDGQKGLVSRRNRSLQHLIPQNTTVPALLRKHFKVVEGEVVALIDYEYLQKAPDLPNVKSAYRELCSAAARKDWAPPKYIQIAFYLFDGEPRDDKDMPFFKRYNLLKECVQSANLGPDKGFFRVIPQYSGFYVSRDKAAENIFKYLKDSDEGIVVRHVDATYARPKMFKMKIPNGEWLVVGHLLRSVDARTNKYETDIRNHKYVKVPEYLMSELLTIQQATPDSPIDVIVNTRRNFVASFHTKWC